MVTTRSQTPATALQHIVTVVLGLGENSTTAQALAKYGAESIYDLISMTETDIDSLTFEKEVLIPATEEGGAVGKRIDILPLPPMTRRKLMLVHQWNDANAGDGIVPLDKWHNLTSTAFDEFRTRPRSVTTSVSASAKAETFTVKRDIGQYKELKDDKHWNQFHRQLLAVGATHGLGEVLDHSDSPKDGDLYKEKNEFLYSIFVSTLKTSLGLQFVREVKDQDGRAVYKKLVQHYEKSLIASAKAHEVRVELQAMRLDASWRGTYQQFLDRWKAKMLDIESITDTIDTDKTKRANLVAALQPNQEMRQIESNAMATEMSQNKLMTFAEYWALAYQQASLHDGANKRSNTSNRRQTVNESNTRTAGRGGSGGRGTQGRGGRNEGRGRHNRDGRGRGATTGRSNNGFVPRELWNQLPAETQALIRQSRPQSNTTQNPASRQANATETQTTASAPVTTVNVPTHDPTDLRSVLSASVAQNSAAAGTATNTHIGQDVKIMGHTFRRIDTHVRYSVGHTSHDKPIGSLVDGGANGGLGGADVLLIETTGTFADVSGIDNHMLSNVAIATVAGLITTHQGPVIGIFHQYAYSGKGKSIHSVGQMMHFGLDVDDRSAKLPGCKQRIVTPDGYIIPLQIRNGLAYMDMVCPTAHDMDTYPHVVFTSDTQWDPSVLDNDVNPTTEPDHPVLDLPADLGYIDRFWDASGHFIDPGIEINVLDRDDSIDAVLRYINSRDVRRKEPDYESLRPCFGWAPLDTIKRTFAATTQMARAVCRWPMRKHFRSRFPALNVPRLQEAVATDTIFSDVPAHDDGAICAQLYVGKTSILTEAFGMKSEKDMPSTLQDFIRKRGAPNLLFSDNAKIQIGNKVKDILRHYGIGDYQSEPHHQHQNFAERRIQTVKSMTSKVLDRSGAPESMWLLALLYVCFLLNHMAVESLNWRTPLEVATGITPDISSLLQFHFWEDVYYATDGSFPGSKEAKGKFVGVAEHVGDALTYKILTKDTQKVIYRSAVRPCHTGADRNLRLDPHGGEPERKPILHTLNEYAEMDPCVTKAFTLAPDDLLGLSYLCKPEEDGQRLRAHITRKIIERDKETEEERIKFLVSIGDGEREEIISYNELLGIIEDQMDRELADTERLWTFKRITGHEGPLRPSDKRYKGSSYNIMVLWEDDSETSEPLDEFSKDDPVTCALYAKDNDLLDTPGWKRFKSIANNEKKFIRMLRQVRLASVRRGPIYKFGVRIPRNHKEAIELDKANGNRKWQDAIGTEMGQIHDYKTFKDLGYQAAGPAGYQKINVHLVFDVKHDLRHKARLVAGGHLTDPPKDSVYSGVVTLRSLRLVLLIAELNGLETMAADIGNAYLEAKTKEKVYIIAGPEFGELQGHTLVIVKALYGLRTSGARWHEKFADTLRDMGFVQSKADPDVWMRDAGDAYEYVCVYVDDLAAALKDAKLFMKTLEEKYGYILKGVGPMKYHLGGDFEREPDGTLSYSAKSYIKKMLFNFEQMFGEKPREYTSPLVNGDHPEVDMSEELPQEGIQKYQSLIGALQWAVSLCRFDIAVAVMTMARFRAAPRVGHMERLKRMYGYLRKFPHAAIRFRTGLPDHSSLEQSMYDWMYSVYGNVQEELPHDMPVPKGKPMSTTTYVDANLFHDMITGRSATGVLHLVNQTPVEWFSKRQATVETATYGSEFVAARIATEQIIDLRYTLRMLGVPLVGPAVMFGDNQSVITSSTIPHSNLSKRHNALAYHRVREAIAAKVLNFYHIDGKKNPADVMTKFLGYQQFWPLIQPLLFWRGDTAALN